MAASGAAMKSSVTSEHMFELYRTAASAMTAVYANASASNTNKSSSGSCSTPPDHAPASSNLNTAPVAAKRLTTSTLDEDGSLSEMLADVKPPDDVFATSTTMMGDSLFGLSMTTDEQAAVELKETNCDDPATHGAGDSSPLAKVVDQQTQGHGSKRSPKERRQQEKERYQTYTLAVHESANNADQGTQDEANDFVHEDVVGAQGEHDASFDPDDLRRRSARKSRTGDKNR
jgi:hypothetical protein